MQSSKIQKSIGSSSKSRIWSAKEQLQRKRPNRTELDSQKLFQQSLKLDSELNQLLDQNKLLKKGLSKVDNVRNYKQGLISSVQNIIKQKSKDLKNTNKTSSWLVYNLKKKMNNMKKQIQAKDKQIQQFNNSKVALILKQKEVQAQLLKQLADKQFVYTQPPPNDILDELIEMRLYKELQHQYVLQLNNDISIEQSNLKNILQEISSLKKQQQLKKQEYEKKKKIQEMYKMQMQMQRIHMQSQDTQQNQQVIQQLQMTRQLQAEQIKELQSKIDKIIERQNAQKKRLQARIDILKQEVITNPRIKNKTMKTLKNENQQQYEQQSIEIKQKVPLKLVSQLKMKDVETIGQYLKYLFSIKRLTHSDWKYLISSDEEQTTISIRELMNIFVSQPFCLESQQTRTKLARYLVEQTSGKFFFDQNIRQQIPIVKSILQKLISSLIIYSSQQQQLLSKQVGQVTQKYSLLIVGGLQTKANKKDYIKKSQIPQVFQACSMQFTAKQVQYIMFYLFGHSQILEQLKYKNITKIGIQPISYRS